MQDQVRQGEPGRFVWPPRRVDEGNGPDAAPIETGIKPKEGVGGDPLEAARAGATARKTVQGPREKPSGRWSQIQEAVLEIEKIWLGQVSAPLAVRIAQAGWAADEAEAYCWRCGMTVGLHEAGEDGCPACRVRRIGCERIVRLGEFKGLLRELVLEIKFTRWRRLGSQVGQMLGRSLTKELEVAGADLDRVVLVPLPTAFRRRMARGIDHPLVIARGISVHTGFPIVRALERKHRPTQQSLPAGKRTANLARAIRVKRWAAPQLAGKHIVLVDDVATTGATLWAGNRAIAAAVPGMSRQRAEETGQGRIWAAVVAVTADEDRRAG